MTKPAKKSAQKPSQPLSVVANENAPKKVTREFNARGQAQQDLVKVINNNTVSFAVGPAGTGKTFVAVALACKAFNDGQVDRIIITRPAVEAGEKIGFLPGDLNEKLYPYMLPVFDALNAFLGAERVGRLREEGKIEIAPIGFMRGRTLSNAFIVADECQNTTKQQMKMIVTRIGEGSQMVITGDPSQCDLDLKAGQLNGLDYAVKALEGSEGFGFHFSTEDDVVRHKAVKTAIKAFDAFDKK